MFLALTQKMLEQALEQEANAASLTRTNSQRRNVVVVDDDQVPAPTNKSCCSSS